MIHSMLREIELRKGFFPKDESIDSIYFGGGSPSLLDQKSIASILDILNKHFLISSKAEITLEANPDDLNNNKIIELIKSGVNRLSVGIQSFHNTELVMMNRVHDAEEASRCIKNTQDAGLDNISIDLIFGMPNSSMASWEYNLQMAIGLDVPHMSCYSLTVEPKTALAHMIHTKQINGVDEELAAEQFQLTINMLAVAQFEHYEISSYARNGQYAIHNTNYWRFVPYLGVGPSAHSYDGQARSWNLANNALYIQSIDQNMLPLEYEQLTVKDSLNEYLMTGLRTKWGCEWERINLIFPEATARLKDEINQFRNNKLIELTEKGFRLSEQGKLYADQISSELFQV